MDFEHRTHNGDIFSSFLPPSPPQKNPDLTASCSRSAVTAMTHRTKFSHKMTGRYCDGLSKQLPIQPFIVNCGAIYVLQKNNNKVNE